MPARTDLDRLTATRPAVLHRTEDVIDATAEDRILHQILSSAPDVAAPGGVRRPAWRRPRLVALGLTSAATAVVTVALALTALTPGSHSATHAPAGPVRQQTSMPSRAVLAAWTVTKLADGKIRVRILQLRDPAGLQAKLRAEGVPANVTDSGSPSGACRPYPSSTVQLSAVFGGGTGATTDIGTATIIVTINPAALPHDAGVHIGGQFNSAGAGAGTSNLVYASARCTGS